jgi:hypothetical protein
MKNVRTGETWQVYGTPYRPTKYSLMTATTLGDKVQFMVDKSLYEGIVTNITMTGVGVYGFGLEHNFVKWCNVLENLSK